MGEYVPYACRTDGRPPRGEPIPNYFPAIVDEATFQRAKNATGLRGKVGRGRRGNYVNLFQGLLKDVQDGGTIGYWRTRARSPGLIPANMREGRDPSRTYPRVTFPADVFENTVLEKLAEIKPSDVFGGGTEDATVKALEVQLAELDALVGQWTGKMDDLSIVNIVAAKLSELSAKRAAVRAELETAKQAAATPADDAWNEVHSLAAIVAQGDTDTRLRVRAAIRRTIEQIDVLLVAGPNKFTKGVAVRVMFRGASAWRSYFIAYHGHARTGSTVRVESGTVDPITPTREVSATWVAFAEARVQGLIAGLRPRLKSAQSSKSESGS